jgi:hypothetical protein
MEERVEEPIDMKHTTIGESLFNKPISHNTHPNEGWRWW